MSELDDYADEPGELYRRRLTLPGTIFAIVVILYVLIALSAAAFVLLAVLATLNFI